MKLIEKLLREVGAESVEVKSVDGYQGREKGIILFSAVRSNAEHEVCVVYQGRLHIDSWESLFASIKN